MEIESIYEMMVISGKTVIEELNFFDNIDVRKTYIEVIGLLESENWTNVKYRDLCFDATKSKFDSYAKVSNWKPYRFLPNGKKQKKGVGELYVSLRYRNIYADKVIRSQRPYWTDDYRHMKGHLDMCDFEGGDLEIVY